ncbi:MAG: amidohydrolase family protein [Armatimonadota bacterium]
MAAVVHKADVLIRGGEVVDGTGAPRRQADVAVKDGRIADVGDLQGWEGDVTLDATGLVVAPGFIDMHTHSDLSLLLNPRAESHIRQGVTTEVIGMCGFSPAPAPGPRADAIRAIFGVWGREVEWEWGSYGEYLDSLRRKGTSVNVVPVVGQGVIRAGIVGEDNRRASARELELMQAAARQALDDGAFGLSTGLYYAPSMFADTDELVALASAMPDRSGIYFSHIRGEGANLFNAVEEAIEIGRRAGVPVEIAHFKAEGRAHWGKTAEALKLVDAARTAGVEVGFDVYPYTAWNTGLGQTLPAWAREGALKTVLARLTDPATRARLIGEIEKEVESDPGHWDQRILASAETERNRSFQGMTIAEIASRRGRSPIETVLDILVEEKMDAGMVGFGMCEEDVRRVLSHPVATIGSDSAASAPYGILGQGHPHPRAYGSFARVLGHYSRDEKLFSLEEAVAKMTSRPAAHLGLTDRGRIAPGLAADIAIFDPASIADTATYQNPKRYAVGVRWVIVNGVVEMDGEEHRERFAGEVLTPGR